MKLLIVYLIKGVLICAVILAIGSYLIYLKTGQFWMPSVNVFNISLPQVEKKQRFKPIPKPTQPIYKWRQGGQWVYGETPPKNVSAERVYQEHFEEVE